MSPLSLLIWPVAILAAASLMSWLAPLVPALEPEVRSHDTCYSLRGSVSAVGFVVSLANSLPGVFALMIVVANPIHMFFATGAPAIWIANVGELARPSLSSTSPR